MIGAIAHVRLDGTRIQVACALADARHRLLGLTLTMLTSAGLYQFLVSSIGHPEGLTRIPPYLNAEPFINVCSSYPCLPICLLIRVQHWQSINLVVVHASVIFFKPRALTLGLMLWGCRFYGFRLFRRASFWLVTCCLH